MTHPARDPQPETVLVLDAAQRAALAVIRTLGRRGIRVIGADASRKTIGQASRYCKDYVTHASPLEHPQQFAEDIVRAVQQHGVTSVYPITDVSTMLLAELAPRLAPARLCAPGASAYAAVTDKGTLVAAAARLGVPVPRTIRATGAEEISRAAAQIGFPAVLKPTRSRFAHEGGVEATAVKIARQASDLPGLLERTAWVGRIPCLVQEFIPGHGAGVFTVFGKSGPLAWFAHRRIREMPPSGGVSVLCESAPVDPAMQDYANRLLRDAGWFGPAMVEFRIGPKGQPYLMEINGRFWGSLQLSIDSGLDFPWLLLQAARGEEERGPGSYVIGRKLRWLLRDVDNLAAQLRDSRVPFSRKLGAIADFGLTAFDLRSHQELFRWHDPKPAFREAALWLGSLSAVRRLSVSTDPT
jgi:predicted ATP-grasp superfamily ATP-dependent carboligase